MNVSNKEDQPDKLSQRMQDEIIRIAESRLGKPLPAPVIACVRQKKWGYMGLEMMIDTVTNINPAEIEDYLAELD